MKPATTGRLHGQIYPTRRLVLPRLRIDKGRGYVFATGNLPGMRRCWWACISLRPRVTGRLA